MKRLKDNKIVKQLFLYLIIGGIATIVEWACFWLFSQAIKINYLLATALAFVVSTFANWLVGKLIMFKKRENIISELIKIYATSVAGLLLNLLFMWIMVDVMNMHEMLSKMISTGIVFMWNFLVRKYLIYKI